MVSFGFHVAGYTRSAMPARTGAQYIQGLKERNMEVWIDGQRITDVTTFPGFQNGIRTMAALLDMQHDPMVGEEMTYESPTTGDRVGLSFLTPKKKGDLERRSRMVRHWALASAGMMGRTPDYVNVSLMAMAAAEGYFAQGSAEFGRNIRNYFEHIRENDLVLTHSLDNFQRNRSPLPEHRALFEERMLHVRKETDAGLIVRGCRRLATLGPISDEVAVYPVAPQQPTQHPQRHALAFCIPNDTPGLKMVCRESFDYGRSRFDHPLGSRFEEMDATVFFHDVADTVGEGVPVWRRWAVRWAYEVYQLSGPWRPPSSDAPDSEVGVPAGPGMHDDGDAGQ